MSKNADLRIVAYDLEVSVPLPDRLVCCIEDLGLFSIVRNAEVHHVLDYVTFCGWTDVDWSSTDLDYRSSFVIGVEGL